MTELVISSRMR